MTAAVAVGVGTSAHIVGDMLTREGVPLLWPWRHRQRLAGLSTGGLVEQWIVAPVLAVAVLWLCWLVMPELVAPDHGRRRRAVGAHWDADVMTAAVQPVTTRVLRALCRTLACSGRTVIIDTETTDFAGQICELAVIEARSGNVLLSTLVRPDVPIAEDARRVHGITPQMCETAPAMAELVPALRSLLRGRVVLTWNAPFDRRVIAAEFQRARLRPPRCWWICLMRLEARVHGRRWRSLAGGHRALSDVVAAREALLALS